MKNMLDAGDLVDAIQAAKEAAGPKTPLTTPESLRELEKLAGIPESSPQAGAAIAKGPKSAVARGDERLAGPNVRYGYQKFELVRDWEEDEVAGYAEEESE